MPTDDCDALEWGDPRDALPRPPRGPGDGDGEEELPMGDPPDDDETDDPDDEDEGEEDDEPLHGCSYISAEIVWLGASCIAR